MTLRGALGYDFYEYSIGLLVFVTMTLRGALGYDK